MLFARLRQNSRGSSLNSYLERTFSANPSEAPTLLEKCIAFLIVCSVIQVVLETEPVFIDAYGGLSANLELFFLVIFCVEYLLRLYYCGGTPDYTGFMGRLRYIVSPYALIDLVSILPSLFFVFGTDLMILRAIRLVRLLRIGRLVRDNFYLRAFIASFMSARAPLIASLCVTMFVLFIGGVLMFLAEGEAQPEAFGSIPRALWWAMATLTTVGYGDVYPITPVGKVLASLIAVMGIGVVAMPAGVIAANFTRELDNGET